MRLERRPGQMLIFLRRKRLQFRAFLLRPDLLRLGFLHLHARRLLRRLPAPYRLPLCVQLEQTTRA